MGKSKIIVTGGAGFLGSHLVDKLLGVGHQIVVLDNLITGSLDNLAQHKSDPNLTFINQNISKPFSYPDDVDFIYHFASPASPVDFSKIPIEVLEVGSLGTHNMLELAYEKKAGLLFSSTSEVYGDPLVSPQVETYWGNVNPIGPRSVYDEGKRFSEALIMAYYRTHDLDTKVVRFFNTYGPRMRIDDGRVVPNFIKQALDGEPLTIYGDGKQTRSFGYYEDILDGVARLAASDYHLPMNIGTLEERTIQQFAELVIKISKSTSKIEYLDALQDDPKQRRPDIELANRILSWTPTTSLELGLSKTIKSFQDLRIVKNLADVASAV